MFAWCDDRATQVLHVGIAQSIASGIARYVLKQHIDVLWTLYKVVSRNTILFYVR